MTEPLPDPRHVPHRFLEPCGSADGTDACWWCALPRALHPRVYADGLPAEASVNRQFEAQLDAAMAGQWRAHGTAEEERAR